MSMAFASLSSREECPFCGSELYTRDIKRHVTDRCKQAKVECIGKNALEVFEKLRAKRKGNQNVASLFSSKQQRTGASPATKPAAGDEDLRRYSWQKGIQMKGMTSGVWRSGSGQVQVKLLAQMKIWPVTPMWRLRVMGGYHRWCQRWRFFIGETNNSTWHFYHTYVKRFYESDHSKTVKILQAQKSRLSFVDK